MNFANTAWLYDRAKWSYGQKDAISINLDKSPHMVIIGNSGSGKSMSALLCCAKLAAHLPDFRLWVLDYKGDSDTFGFLEKAGNCRYWQYAECMAGLESYYSVFEERLSHNPGPNAALCLLWVDELASFILNLPKKEAETAKTMMSTALMMGRSKRCQILTTTQRASATLFSEGARDNYSVRLAMGNISRESATMLGFDRDEFRPVTQIGGGHLLLDGADQRPVQVPYISQRGMEKIREAILQAATRPPSEA